MNAPGAKDKYQHAVFFRQNSQVEYLTGSQELTYGTQ